MWGMAGWTGSDLDEVNRALRRSVNLGCNFFDTAWGYGAGKSEALLGDLVRDFPDRKLYTATKIPPKNLKWPSRREFSVDDCFPPEHIEEYVTASLSNAGLSSFDLMQFHTWEDDWLKDDRWYHKLSDLKSQGLFDAIGVSQNRWEPWNGIAAVKSGLIDCVQVIYNIFDQNPQDELFPACQQHDVGVIARVPFDEGTLTGTLTKSSSWPDDDWRSHFDVGSEHELGLERLRRNRLQRGGRRSYRSNERQRGQGKPEQDSDQRPVDAAHDYSDPLSCICAGAATSDDQTGRLLLSITTFVFRANTGRCAGLLRRVRTERRPVAPTSRPASTPAS